jgi:hypothetical protein
MRPDPSAIYKHGENSTYQKVTDQSASCVGSISGDKTDKKVERPIGPEANNGPGK